MVERRTLNPCAAGSNPATGAKSLERDLMKNILRKILIITFALIINASIFTIIPATSHLSEDDISVNSASQNKVVATLVKTKEKEKKKDQKVRLRNVSNASPSKRDVSSKMKFKFSPDLSSAVGGDGAFIKSNDLEAEVFEDGDVDIGAQVVFVNPPKYPTEARNQSIEGTVSVTFVVGVSGKVDKILEIESSHPSFAVEVRKVYKDWKFKPAMKKGIPVSSKVMIPFNFDLN